MHEIPGNINTQRNAHYLLSELNQVLNLIISVSKNSWSGSKITKFGVSDVGISQSDRMQRKHEIQEIKLS